MHMIYTYYIDIDIICAYTYIMYIYNICVYDVNLYCIFICMCVYAWRRAGKTSTYVAQPELEFVMVFLS